MSRSGYSEDCEQWDLIRWRGAVASALRGKRGQAFLREALAALDALPEAKLITQDLITFEYDPLVRFLFAPPEPDPEDRDPWGWWLRDEQWTRAFGSREGGVCLLGAVGSARGVDMLSVDPEDRESVAGLFGIPHAMACEIMWENDEAGPGAETPRARWERMRRWIVRNLRDDQPSSASDADSEGGAPLAPVSADPGGHHD